MHIRKYILSILLLSSTLGTTAQSTQSDFRKDISGYFENYSRTKAHIDKAKMLSCAVDTDSMTIRIVAGGGFQEQFFTHPIVDSVYKDIRALIPEEWQTFNLEIMTEGHRIEDLIPNLLRKGNKDHSRLLKTQYTGAPWVTNASRPYQAPKGLDGAHIALWQSHGKYFKYSANEWTWQRPRLFCTNEDLFSQTFVIPYIIPMLQNAGAVVFTPRERDWQSNEVIVDNDTPGKDGYYIETYRSSKQVQWKQSKYAGFANYKQTYESCDSPFIDGSSRFIPTVTQGKGNAFAQWVPDIPESGRYAVYVAYRTAGNSVSDAHYRVMHKGGATDILVNQKMGGGTWVYIGTYEFDKGTSDNGMVVLSNLSKDKGIVSADAVRFGGGMGNYTPRNKNNELMPVSGLPRWAEAAKYSTFWYGMPYSIHTGGFGTDDYSNDINCRSKTVNYLSGGSTYNKGYEGVKVPLETTVAFHTDAGFSKTDEFVGSLSIYRTNFNNGLTGAGLDRYVSRDLASMLLTNLTTDLESYGWQVRQLWNRNYGEAREPLTPTCILEMLSHQNFADMRLGHDPHFKFDFARSVYKTIVKFIATEHKRSYIIQPLPVHNFSISLNEHKGTAELAWAETKDPLEPTAYAQQYIVYTRVGNGDFDNGTIVKGTTHSVKLNPDVTYSFRVAAVNLGGESFPSETLSAGIASHNEGTVLIVNGFTRLEGPQVINTDSTAGFDLDADPGVPYGAFAGYCGRQLSFDRSKAGIETATGLGYSGNELEGQVIMGNTFDYPFLHGRAIMSTHRHSFTSTSEGAFNTGLYNLSKYNIIDVIYGVQKEFNKQTASTLNRYMANNGHLLISGANIAPLLSQMKELKASATGTLTDKTKTGISGSNLTFDIHREMNSRSYSVPAPTLLSPEKGAFAMLQYSDGTTAGIAYSSPEKPTAEMVQQEKGKKDKSKKKKGGNNYTTIKQNTNSRCIVLGFPLESITDPVKMNQMTKGCIRFFEK